MAYMHTLPQMSNSWVFFAQSLGVAPRFNLLACYQLVTLLIWPVTVYGHASGGFFCVRKLL